MKEEKTKSKKSEPKKRPRNAVIYLFMQAWKYAAEDRSTLVKIWIAFLFAGIINLYVNPMAWAKLTDTIQAEGVHPENINRLLVLLGIMLASTVGFWMIHGPARVYERTTAFGIRMRFRQFFLNGVMNLPMVWHNNNHSGDTIDKIDKGTRALFDFAEDSFEILYTFIKLIGSFAILLYFFPMASIGVCAMMLFTFWVTTRFDKLLMEQYIRLNKSENVVTQQTFDTISNITTVIILRVEKLVFDAIMHRVKEPEKLFKQNAKLNEWKWFVVSLSCTLTITVVLAVYLWKQAYSATPVLLGELYLLNRYLGNISEVFSRFASIYGEVMKGSARLNNAEELSTHFTDQTFANHVLPQDWKTLSIRGLTFAYDAMGNGPHQLQGINLDIQHGEKLAFVGESGSGKTTLLKLIRGLYTPSGMTLTVDGVEVEDGFDGIARGISLIPQMPEIFTNTILQNITMGAEYPDDVVQEFIDMALFTDVVKGLPKGLESSVNEKGVNLSGGQQQRLALARGLLASRGRDIVLLDEPTSSLDTATEAAVYQNIFDAFAGQTIISSIHRLHLLGKFDRIVMFDKGGIIAVGTLDELLADCPMFESLWQQYQSAAETAPVAQAE